MKSLIWCVAFSSLFAGTLAKTTQAQAVENFSQYSRTGAKVGTLTVHQAGGIVDVYYSVSDNGRGPKTFEHIVIGKNGLPSSWTITGHSYAGGAVRENMEVVSGHAVWDSLAEKGSSADAEDKPYIAANGSPWSLALYARLAANKPQGKLEVLPSGTLRAQKRQSLAVGKMDARSRSIFTLSTVWNCHRISSFSTVPVACSRNWARGYSCETAMKQSVPG